MKTDQDIQIEQLQYRLDFRVLCFERAVDKAEYDKANIHAAQAEYIAGRILQLGGVPIISNPHFAK